MYSLFIAKASVICMIGNRERNKWKRQKGKTWNMIYKSKQGKDKHSQANFNQEKDEHNHIQKSKLYIRLTHIEAFTVTSKRLEINLPK